MEPRKVLQYLLKQKTKKDIISALKEIRNDHKTKEQEKG